MCQRGLRAHRAGWLGGWVGERTFGRALPSIGHPPHNVPSQCHVVSTREGAGCGSALSIDGMALRCGGRVVAGTSALEMGVNIQGLDVVVMKDCPSDVMSIDQQIGRAGRQVGRPGEHACTHAHAHTHARTHARALTGEWAGGERRVRVSRKQARRSLAWWQNPPQVSPRRPPTAGGAAADEPVAPRPFIPHRGCRPA